MEITEPIRYSIVIPLFNEEHSVRELYSRIVTVMREFDDPYQIIFIDDGSRDGTHRLASEICDGDSRVVLIRLRKNFGQTAALKAGFDFARGEVIISMDGDLQHDPAEIPAFIAKLEEGYDIVSGWRYERQDNWLMRRIPSRIANWLLAKLSGVELHDFGTTFKAYRQEAIKDLPLYGDSHRFIPALASWSGATIAEIPIKNINRQSGKSNYGISRTLTVFLDLISLKFLLDYSTKPLQFFGSWGLLSSGAGFAAGLFLLYEKFVQHLEIMKEHGPMLFAAVLLIVCGIQLISVGLIGEMLSRTYYESQRKPTYAVREVKSRPQIRA
ncbi:MAG TPA: glycosyltransferase family 2 protein [Terriglobia bacterium]|jgi:glycosyltransferase involved in cell wall biosynthesis